MMALWCVRWMLSSPSVFLFPAVVCWLIVQVSLLPLLLLSNPPSPEQQYVNLYNGS